MGVFVLSVIASIGMLSLCLAKDQTFFRQLSMLGSAKQAVVKRQNVMIMLRELVSIANGEQAPFSDFSLPNSSSGTNFLLT